MQTICPYGDCEKVETKDIKPDEWILDLEDIEKDTGNIISVILKKDRNSVSTKHKFYKGQLLYSKLRPYLSKVVIAINDGYCTSEILPLKLFGSINPSYMQIYLMSEVFLSYVNMISYGVKMPRLGTEDGRKALIALPPLMEQYRIVEAFNNIKPIIKSIEANSIELKDIVGLIKSQILDLAIRGKLVPQNPDDEPASVLLERIRTEKEDLIKQGKIKRDKKESVIFKGEDNSYYDAIIPQSWEITNLSDVTLNISDGSHNPPPKKNKGVPLLSATNIYDNKINYTSATRWITEDEWIIENARTKIEVGDVLITIVGTIGRTAVVSNTTRFALQRSVAVIKPNMIDSKYLMYVLQAPMIIEWLNANAKGNAQVGIYLKDLEKLSFPLPPLAEQKRIVDAIETAFAQLDEISNSIS